MIYAKSTVTIRSCIYLHLRKKSYDCSIEKTNYEQTARKKFCMSGLHPGTNPNPQSFQLFKKRHINASTKRQWYSYMLIRPILFHQLRNQGVLVWKYS